MFSPADGTTFTDNLSVTLSCSNPTDATIYYTTDGTTPDENSEVYDSSKGISISSTTTVKAIAVDGNGTLTQSEVATATYTKLSVLTFAELREAIDTDASSTAKTYAVNLDGAVVTYVYNNTASIEKNGMGILFYGTNTFTAGDVLTGTATVTALTYNGAPEITTMTGQTVTSGGTAPEPTTVTISDIQNSTSTYLCRYVKVENATVGTAVTSSNRNGTITDSSSETELTLRSNASTLTADAGTLVNVTGIVQQYQSSPQIIFYEQSQIEELGSTFTISLSEGYATYYNAKAYIMPEGVVGYIITGTELNSVTADERGTLSIEEKYKAGSTVPAGTALLLNGDPGTYTFSYTTSEETAPTGNLLHGADAVDDSGYTYVEGTNVKYYLLSLNAAEEEGSLGFYWYDDDGAAILYVSPYAFLAVDFGSTSGVKMFTLGEESTGIRSLAGDTDGAKDAAIYTLAGQHVSHMAKGGIYIMNGKKVLVR